MKILFATPAGGGLVHWQFLLSTTTQLFLAPDRLLNQSHYDIAQYLVGGYSGLGKDRGIMASFALRNNFDKLFFVDSDQSWKWEDCKKLFDSAKPIVAGMVPLKRHPIQLNFAPTPALQHYFAPEEGAATPKGVDRWRAENPGQDEMPVSAMGTGFMVIDVGVLRELVTKNLVEPFLYSENRENKKETLQCWDFFPSGPLGNNYYGEDYGFCILAQRAGVPVHINTSVEIPHHGQFEYQVRQVENEYQAAQPLPTDGKSPSSPVDCEK